MKKLSKKRSASIVVLVVAIILCAIPTMAYSTFKSSEIAISPVTLKAGDIVFSDCYFCSYPDDTVMICYCDNEADAAEHKYSGGEVLEGPEGKVPCDTTCYLPDGSVGAVNAWVVYECTSTTSVPGITYEAYFYPCSHESVTTTQIDEKSLVATCKICGMSGTISITASDAEYDGASKEATVEGADFFAEEPLIYYEGTDNDYQSSDAPTNVGKYVAYLSYRNNEDVKISAAFEITPSETPEEPTPEEPEDPTPDEPEEPTPDEPEEPTPEEPEEPTPDEPEEPTIDEPENPTIDEPENPTIDEPEDPTPDEPETDPSVPETGDASNVSLYAIISILSAVLILLVWGYLKKNNKNYN